MIFPGIFQLYPAAPRLPGNWIDKAAGLFYFARTGQNTEFDKHGRVHPTNV